MSWIQFGFKINKKMVEQVEDKLLELGAVAISLEDAEDDGIFEPGDNTPIWEHTIIKGLYTAEQSDVMQELKEWVSANLPEEAQLTFLQEEIVEEDWLAATKASFPPIKMAEHLWVIPKWHAEPINDAINLVINPGLAFGTGNHATTALCLEWLSDQNLTEKNVLDYGCGSGILAIGSLLLGAKTAWGTDIDDLALQASLENSQLNDLSAQIITHEMSDAELSAIAFKIAAPKNLPAFKTDFLVANILAKPLITLAPILSSYLAENSHICLSGILERQADDVMQAYAQWVEWEEPTFRDGWTRLTGKRK